MPFVRYFFVLILLALGACGKKEPEGFVLYREPNNLFICRAPGDWRVLENQGGSHLASFLGPASGPQSYSVSIAFYYHGGPEAGFSSPRDYYNAHLASGGRVFPLREEDWKGVKTFRFRSEKKAPLLHSMGETEERTEDTVLIPSKEGFLAVVHSAPSASLSSTESVFKEMLESLRL